jgi:hypothetical protein
VSAGKKQIRHLSMKKGCTHLPKVVSGYEPLELIDEVTPVGAQRN